MMKMTRSFLCIAMALFPLAAMSEPQNIILYIGDGMGPNEVTYAEYVENGFDDEGNVKLFDFVNTDSFPFQDTMGTRNMDGLITDSAASATAMYSGEKTVNGRVGEDYNGLPVHTIVEDAKARGMKVGVVTTADILDATPACLFAHEDTRHSYNEILEDMITMMADGMIDLVMGGGSRHIASNIQFRLSDENILLVGHEYELDDMENRMGTGDEYTCLHHPLVGVFASGHIDYELYREYDHQPSLDRLSSFAIDCLSQDNENGFLLVVEGGLIDKAGHHNDEVRNALETIAFASTVELMTHKVQDEVAGTTLSLVTADHETGGLEVVEESIRGLQTTTLALPSTFDDESKRREQRVQRADLLDVTWVSKKHSARQVGVSSLYWRHGWSTHAGSYDHQCIADALPESGSIENTHIYTLMKAFLDGEVKCEFTPDPVVPDQDGGSDNEDGDSDGEGDDEDEGEGEGADSDGDNSSAAVQAVETLASVVGNDNEEFRVDGDESVLEGSSSSSGVNWWSTAVAAMVLVGVVGTVSVGVFLLVRNNQRGYAAAPSTTDDFVVSTDRRSGDFVEISLA